MKNISFNKKITNFLTFFSCERQRIEEFKKCFDKAINDLENLHVVLLDNKSIRANETDQAMKYCTKMNDDVQKAIRSVIDNGKLKIMFDAGKYMHC